MKFFLKYFEALIRFLFSQEKPSENDTPTVVKTPTKPTSTVSSSKSPLKPELAWVRGHNSKSPGAYTARVAVHGKMHERESEWAFYGPTRVGGKLVSKCTELGLGTILLNRLSNVSYSIQTAEIAGQMKRLGIKFAILLHFDSVSNPKAHGCSVLIMQGVASDKVKRLADYITDELNELLGIRERNNDGIKLIKSDHGGYGMMARLKQNNIESGLIEIGFMSNPEEAKLLLENENVVVDLLSRAAHKFVRGTLPVID